MLRRKAPLTFHLLHFEVTFQLPIVRRLHFCFSAAAGFCKGSFNKKKLLKTFAIRSGETYQNTHNYLGWQGTAATYFHSDGWMDVPSFSCRIADTGCAATAGFEYPRTVGTLVTLSAEDEGVFFLLTVAPQPIRRRYDVELPPVASIRG